MVNPPATYRLSAARFVSLQIGSPLFSYNEVSRRPDAPIELHARYTIQFREGLSLIGDVVVELLEHPADMGFRVHAPSLPQLFAACAVALVSIILDTANVQHTEQCPMTAEGNDCESLLVNWLNEVLYYTDAQRLALDVFDIVSFHDTRIECMAHGERRNASKHPAKLIIKAVTYHQLRVLHTAEGDWSADIYVDV